MIAGFYFNVDIDIRKHILQARLAQTMVERCHPDVGAQLLYVAPLGEMIAEKALLVFKWGKPLRHSCIKVLQSILLEQATN